MSEQKFRIRKGVSARIRREVVELILVHSVRSSRRIYAFGDSHIRLLYGVRGLYAAHIGPVTLYRAGRPGEARQLYKTAFRWRFLPSRYPLPFPQPHPRATIVLSFGEIDCRCHVGLQIERHGAHPDFVIDDLVSRAEALVETICGLGRCRVLFLALPPPSSNGYSHEFPIMGELPDRIAWCRAINSGVGDRLAERRDLNVGFVDYTAAVTAADGSLLESMSDGGVHLSKACRPLVLGCIKSAVNAHESSRQTRDGSGGAGPNLGTLSP